MDVADLDLGNALTRRLHTSGLSTTDELVALCGRELVGIPGVGPAAVTRIEAALAVRGLTLATDEWAPLQCAREGRPRGDATMATFWLCDECTAEFVEKPFGGEEPLWTGQSVDALCSHCYRPRRVQIRQWVVCPVCERVLRSIGKGIVAARYVLDTWERIVSPDLPGIELRETDPPGLRRRTADAAKTKVALADFTAFEDDRPLFGVELKSGPGAAGPRGIGKAMSEFQLDASDCDDITAVAEATRLPMFLVHAQIRSRPSPPTLECVATGMWWVPSREMHGNLRSVRNRPRETRPACYFNTAMFRPIQTIAEAVMSQWFDEERRRVSKGDIPTLYEFGRPT